MCSVFIYNVFKLFSQVFVTLLFISSCSLKSKKLDRNINAERSEDLMTNSFFLQETTYMNIIDGVVFVHGDILEELVTLKKALEDLFKQTCSEPEHTGGVYRINVSSCIPSHVSKYLGSRTRSIPGPECYSYALYPLGLIDHLQRVMEASEELFFRENSPFCEAISYNSRKPGDIVFLGNHGFMFLTDKYALSAAGAGRVYEITTNSENLDLSFIESLSGAKFYRCARPSQSIPNNLRDAELAIKSFGAFIQNYLFTDGLSQSGIESLSAEIDKLDEALTREVASEFLKHLDNPIILLRIYNLMGLSYTVGMVRIRLSHGVTANTDLASTYNKVNLKFLKVLERFANTNHAYLFGTTVVSFAADYCEDERSEIPVICEFGDAYFRGETTMFHSVPF